MSFRTTLDYLSNNLALENQRNFKLASTNNALQASLQDALSQQTSLLVQQTNLLARVQDAEATVYKLQMQLEPLGAQQGWTNIFRSSLVKLAAANGRSSPLTISTNIFLWVTEIDSKSVTVRVNSMPPGAGGTQYLHEHLTYGESKNFTVADFDYKITVEDILYSDSDDNSKVQTIQPAQSAANSNRDLSRSSAAVFSVDRRMRFAPSTRKKP